MLISIETHITCDFPGGGGGLDPLSPIWIRTCGAHACLTLDIFPDVAGLATILSRAN